MGEGKFGTKAETLDFLYGHADELCGKVLRPCYFTVREWKEHMERVLSRLGAELADCPRLIVRSSAKSEDSEMESMAGRYESLVCSQEREALAETIGRVIASYGSPRDDDQVLVQEAVDKVESAGVVFSLEPNMGGHYYVINYDDSTGSSFSVTSGSGEATKLFYWYAGEGGNPHNPQLAKVCRVVDELKKLLGREALDIEFLFHDEELYILQARPLIVKTPVCDRRRQTEVLRLIRQKIRYENREKPYLFGRRTMYGVMPDWNPAEMIGIHPKNLALSLYKEIITDEVWAYQRDNYGYKRLRSFPLMVDFGGYPYIDVRVSFNSFIPADLDGGIAEKLVNYYLDRLEESPDKHDKVEFDVVFSCYTFDLLERIQVLKEYGFSSQEIDVVVSSLRNLTKKIIDSQTGLWRKDAEKLAVLVERREKIEASDLSLMDKAFWLLEDCKRYGTLPFAGLARAGFIAVQMLKSMVAKGIISREERDAFMRDLQTVGSGMKEDYRAMDRKTFLSKYGFLRPGTYDICSARYDEAPDMYFSWEPDEVQENDGRKDFFRLSLPQMERIKSTLVEHGMGDNVLELFSFLKGAIEGREKAKFIFTRNVSDILKYLGEWGESLGFSREDLAYADIGIVKKVYSDAVDEKKLLEHSVEEGRKRYQEGLGVVLPPLLVRDDQVFSFFVPDSQPSYITQKRVEGEICKDIAEGNRNLENRILLIESADPGYDWIFSHAIKGFITKYGGANSHMAIRAGELSIPAVIGAGKRLYDAVFGAEMVEIDAANKTVRILR
ncbi:hypothetical protein NZ47_09320 [Anaerovibrio lipolyticus]|uniref:Phosphoenolpyruvate synthase n=1 Tax=Anaerovibrio lipolyticus TaxID=82374 RepID=A0A0B2JVK7_9FIRM|nr:PEP/pyruvate-binding domain-containing protein [Anaerovibrio lipolyticus]KHM51659.1 hypothetical protein NZ47_09320 [Anaerovibrio lipolyticus]